MIIAIDIQTFSNLESMVKKIIWEKNRKTQFLSNTDFFDMFQKDKTIQDSLFDKNHFPFIMCNHTAKNMIDDMKQYFHAEIWIISTYPFEMESKIVRWLKNNHIEFDRLLVVGQFEQVFKHVDKMIVSSHTQVKTTKANNNIIYLNETEMEIKNIHPMCLSWMDVFDELSKVYGKHGQPILN